MALTPEDTGGILRERGLRSTPQRRAILSAFSGRRDEHLSAEEVYARAAASLPDLSRGTVYATLAEFTELGLLGAVGAPEPVRYETNTARHPHFRCRLCLRLFDLKSGAQDPAEITDPGFSVERVDTRAEGICAECNDYAASLDAAAQRIAETGPAIDVLAAEGVAAAVTEGPLGTMMLAATPTGLIRAAFPEHADYEALRAWAAGRRGAQAARRQLEAAAGLLHDYLAGNIASIPCTIDWTFLSQAGAAALRSIGSIPYGAHRSYADFTKAATARELGSIFGSNPIPIFAPCHRVIRGVEIPGTFVGGPERRVWLDKLEATSGAPRDPPQPAD